MVNPACLICGVVNLASLHPQKRLRLLHVIANQCMGALQRGTLCGERSPKGAHGGLWGDARCGNPRPRRETMQSLLLLGQNCSAFRICLKCYSLLCPTAGEADCHVASLLAMTCRNMQLPAVATAWCHGKFVTPCAFALSTALRPAGAILCCNSFTPGASGRQSPVWPRCCRRAPPAPG